MPGGSLLLLFVLLLLLLMLCQVVPELFESDCDNSQCHQVYSAEVKSRTAASKFNIRPSLLGEPHILIQHHSSTNHQVESSPASSVPSKSSVSSTDTSWRPSTDSGRQTESDSSCELTQELTRGLARGSTRELTHTELTRDLNLATISGVSLPSLPTGINSLAILDQSCSSLPSQSNASSGSSQEQVPLEQIFSQLFHFAPLCIARLSKVSKLVKSRDISQDYIPHRIPDSTSLLARSLFGNVMESLSPSSAVSWGTNHRKKRFLS